MTIGEIAPWAALIEASDQVQVQTPREALKMLSVKIPV
jgi:hypothetical protein